MPHRVTATEAVGGASATLTTEATVTSRLTDLSRRLAELATSLSASCQSLSPVEVMPAEPTAAVASGIDQLLSECEEGISRVEAFAGTISRSL